MRPVWIIIVLVVLFIAGMGISGLLIGSPGAIAVLAGGIMPIAISGTSLALFLSSKSGTLAQEKYQRFVVINFIVKVLLIGVWTAAVLLSTSLPVAPFIVSLLVNFFLWHLFEAYRYQSLLKQGISELKEREAA